MTIIIGYIALIGYIVLTGMKLQSMSDRRKGVFKNALQKTS